MSYTILLSHLNRPSSSLPIPSISASLAHFLASLLPTPLTAITVSSPLFNSPLSHVKLSVLFTTFRHAVHLTHKSLVDDQSAEGLGLLFSRGVKVRLGEWVAGVLKGLEGGMGVLKLACAGGVLLGLGDLEMGSGEAGRGRVENEVVVALAEVMELFESAQDGGDWEKEFQPVTERGEGMFTIGVHCKYTDKLFSTSRRAFISPDTRIPLSPSDPHFKSQGPISPRTSLFHFSYFTLNFGILIATHRHSHIT
jgi:hypothetical protein